MGKHNYIGITEETAGQLIGDKWNGKFAYILCNNQSIIEFAKSPGNSDTAIDVYLSYDYLPPAEIRRAILHTLDGIGKWKSAGVVVDDKRSIFEKTPDNPNLNRNRMNRDFIYIEPLAVVKVASDTYHSIVMKWNFGETPWKSLNSLQYVLASCRGSFWMDSDFDSGTRYGLSGCWPYFLRNCILLECSLSEPIPDWGPAESLEQ
jgi:hypothetical protein